MKLKLASEERPKARVLRYTVFPSDLVQDLGMLDFGDKGEVISLGCQTLNALGEREIMRGEQDHRPSCAFVHRHNGGQRPG